MLPTQRFGGLWYGEVNMFSGKRTGTSFGSLEAFYPALLSLSGDMKRAKALEESCFRMWTLYHIEPEEIDYATMKVTAKAISSASGNYRVCILSLSAYRR